MAKVYNNIKGHLVIHMNDLETTKCGFGFRQINKNNVCICGTCNNNCKPEDIYYIAGINEVMCGECIDDYCKNMAHYTDEDSLLYEVRHFNFIAEKLEMSERATITPNNKVVIYDKTQAENY